MSNRLRHELDAIIHVRKGYIQLPDKWVPLRKHSKWLSVVDLSDLLCGSTADCLQANVTTDSRGRPQQHQTPKPGSRQQLSNQRPLPETSLRQPSLTTPDFESKECSEVAGPDAESRCGRAALQGPQRGTDPPRGVHRRGIPPTDRDRDPAPVEQDRPRPPGRKAQGQEARRSTQPSRRGKRP